VALTVRQILTATIGFIAMIALPAIAFYWVRRNYRP